MRPLVRLLTVLTVAAASLLSPVATSAITSRSRAVSSSSSSGLGR